MTIAQPADPTVRLGLRENVGQFALLVVVNAFVGAMVGLERSILPAIAEQEFQLAARTAMLSFIVVFGFAKALTNYGAGRLSDRWGRKHVLVAGWLVAVPVPFLLMWASTWNWVLVANVLLGISQGLTWSTTVIMKIDLVGSRQRGLAMGLNECAGYVALAASALATGWIAARYGLRPQPFYLGVGFAISGLALSALFVQDTRHHVSHESALVGTRHPERVPTARDVFWRTNVGRREPVERQPGRARQQPERRDGLGPVPARVRRGRDGPSASGTARGHLSGHLGFRPAGNRRALGPHGAETAHRLGHVDPGCWIVVTTLAQAFAGFVVGAVLLGIGTAMVYPTLLAAIGDVAHPSWRASAVGVYRLWRDLGMRSARCSQESRQTRSGWPPPCGSSRRLTFVSGVVSATRMAETLPPTVRTAPRSHRESGRDHTRHRRTGRSSEYAHNARRRE